LGVRDEFFFKEKRRILGLAQFQKGAKTKQTQNEEREREKRSFEAFFSQPEGASDKFYLFTALFTFQISPKPSKWKNWLAPWIAQVKFFLADFPLFYFRNS
jgi:hypothetical protein